MAAKTLTWTMSHAGKDFPLGRHAFDGGLKEFRGMVAELLRNFRPWRLFQGFWCWELPKEVLQSDDDYWAALVTFKGAPGMAKSCDLFGDWVCLWASGCE